MKRMIRRIQIAALMAMVVMGLLGCTYRIAEDRAALADMVRQEAGLDEMTVSYIGEYRRDSQALVCFLFENGSLRYYRAAQCELLSEERYRLMEVDEPTLEYTTDIVQFYWHPEGIWLINDPECSKIVAGNDAANVKKEITLSQQDLPYIFVMDDTMRTWTFLDCQGNQIP